MASLRSTLRRLRREVEGPMVAVPQRGGRPRFFPQRDLATAYLIALRRIQGESCDHELCRAARNSSSERWSEGIYAEDVAAEPPKEMFE